MKQYSKIHTPYVLFDEPLDREHISGRLHRKCVCCAQNKPDCFPTSVQEEYIKKVIFTFCIVMLDFNILNCQFDGISFWGNKLPCTFQVSWIVLWIVLTANDLIVASLWIQHYVTTTRICKKVDVI